MPKINPFRPNHPVNPGMFVGRLTEVEALEAALFQTRAGQPKNFMITGERGIGKTSLLNWIRYVAQGQVEVDNTLLNFLVVDTDVEPGTTSLALVRKIEAAIRRALGHSEPAKRFLAEAWDFVKRVEAFGVKINPGDAPATAEAVMEDFAHSLATTVNRLHPSCDARTRLDATFDGVLILIDECDKASPELGLGAFLKLTLERVQRAGCEHVMFGIAGLPDLPAVLRESHPSSLRLFDECKLGRLSHEDVSRVIERCLEVANTTNEEKTTIEEAGRHLLVALSEGYPHFIQQFGYCAFAIDTDNQISEDDVGQGAFGARGGLELIADRYYRDDFYNKIQKDSYRQVLRIMAEKLDGWITKQEIRAKFKGNESVLTNALHALRDRRIIQSKEGERGVYRLQHKGFALWIRLYTTPRKQIQSELRLSDIRAGEA